MIPLIKAFFFDETAFIRFSRALLAAAGFALHEGIIPVEWLHGRAAWWAGPAFVVASFLLGAGDKTPPEVKALTNGK